MQTHIDIPVQLPQDQQDEQGLLRALLDSEVVLVGGGDVIVNFY